MHQSRHRAQIRLYSHAAYTLVGGDRVIEVNAEEKTH